MGGVEAKRPYDDISTYIVELKRDSIKFSELSLKRNASYLKYISILSIIFT